MNDGSVNDLNSTALQRQTNHQLVHWLPPTPLNQRNEKREKHSKKSSANEESVIALSQNAEPSRVPSPSKPDIQIGQVSPPDSRIRYYEYEEEESC